MRTRDAGCLGRRYQADPGQVGRLRVYFAADDHDHRLERLGCRGDGRDGRHTDADHLINSNPTIKVNGNTVALAIYVTQLNLDQRRVRVQLGTDRDDSGGSGSARRRPPCLWRYPGGEVSVTNCGVGLSAGEHHGISFSGGGGSGRRLGRARPDLGLTTQDNAASPVPDAVRRRSPASWSRTAARITPTQL